MLGFLDSPTHLAMLLVALLLLFGAKRLPGSAGRWVPACAGSRSR